jgi:hypothetical protein
MGKEIVIDRAKEKLAAERIRARAARLPYEPFDWSALKAGRDKCRP